ncbi:outer membrane beta-barrel protein [Bacteroidota bacterium]
MKNTITFILLAFFMLIFVDSSKAQSIRLGFGGGLTTLQGPKDFTDDIAKGGLGFGSEYHLGGIAKVGLPLLPIRIIGQVYYNSLGSEGEGKEYSTSILSVGLGAEWSLAPGPIKPYLGADLSLNSFGEMEVDGKVADGSKGVTRYGLGVGIGTEITILPKIDLDIKATYNMYNLFGKEEKDNLTMAGNEEETISSLNFTLNILFSLL